jgi:hypothetical protein
VGEKGLGLLGWAWQRQAALGYTWTELLADGGGSGLVKLG